VIKKLTCIECPKGCLLSIQAENNKLISVTGNECPKGEDYALSEIENPFRILTSTVLCKDMDLKMLPVRTDKPIPKQDILRAMDEIRKITVDRPVSMGAVIVENFLDLELNLIATRELREVAR